MDWALWVGIAAIVIAAGFGGAEFLRINSSDIPEPGAAAEVARTLPAADAGIPADSSATAGVTDDGTATAVAGTKVFSTPENAARAAADAEARDASVRCGVYRFGNKFMVSPFEAPDAEACTLFIRNYSDRFPGLWTYTAR